MYWPGVAALWAAFAALIASTYFYAQSIRGHDGARTLARQTYALATFAVVMVLAGRRLTTWGLDTMAAFSAPEMSFPNGCHVCEVEVDPETGVVQVVGYAAVDDVGHVIHETIVDGQIHGRVAQGLGQVFGEQVVYGEDGQLLTASFMDYPMPRADDLPMLKLGHHVAPCTTNPLGVKGAGESGVAGSIPAGVNAVLDALAARGVTHLDMPMTPQRVWQALNKGGQA